uniref:Ig-like domain-containing protein n=1 Tax=Xiphophorus couchianus TaxID=32473 RepID=A0A3B5M1V2_9TELE
MDGVVGRLWFCMSLLGSPHSAAVLVLDGEAGWVSCPLFSHPAVYNYTTAQSAGHDLVWYRLLDGHDLEQPIPYSSRVSRERERLWLQPAVANDTGQYICMLRTCPCFRTAFPSELQARVFSEKRKKESKWKQSEAKTNQQHKVLPGFWVTARFCFLAAQKTTRRFSFLYSDVHLTCRGQLPFIIDKPEREIWWTVDGKRVERVLNQTNKPTGSQPNQ